MSWEAPPEPRRRWGTAAGAFAVVLVVVAGVAAFRLTDPPPGSTINRVEHDPIGTDLDASSTDDDLAFGPTDVSSDVGAGPLLADPPPLTVVIADFGSRLQLVDLATGTRQGVSVFTDGTRQRPDALQVIGDSLIFDAAGRVLRLVRGDEGAPQQLARGHRSIPTADETSVWVYDQLNANIGGTASRVGFDGTIKDRIELPALAQPLAGTTDGVIVRTPGTISWIDADGDAELIARGQALASDGTHVARLDCLADLSCGVVVGTVDDPDRLRVALRPGDVPAGLFDVAQGRFSPDGQWLALPVYRELNRERSERSSVAIIDTSVGAEVDRLEGSALTAPVTPLAWSPDSRWLAVSTGTGMSVWSTERRGAVELAVRLPPTYAIAMR